MTAGIQHFAEEQISFTLVLNPGQTDESDSAGTYMELRSFIRIRSKPVYINDIKDRLIFHDGDRWVITSEVYFNAVYCDRATGGFYASQSTQGAPSSANWGPRYSLSQ